MRAIIIEDEQLAIDALIKLIEDVSEMIHVVDIARDGMDAIQKIERIKPDLIFLDIEIPVMNGLEVLRKLSYNPRVIFTTAYSHYAVDAFEVNSIDYLLKPISRARFLKTMERLRSSPDYIDSRTIFQLLSHLTAPKVPTSFTVKQGDRLLFVPLEEITHFFAEEKYVLLNTLESAQHITSSTLQELAEKLPSNFIRISRSVIINFDHILEAQKHFGRRYAIRLRDHKHTEVFTGESFVNEFMERIQKI